MSVSGLDKADYWFDSTEYDLQTAKAMWKHADCFM